MGAMPGGGAAREVTAADGTQAACIGERSVHIDWHMHDADATAALLLPVGSGPDEVIGVGAMESCAVAPASAEWAAG